MIRGVESVERKLSPVGFNAFAIIGLLVILPFSTAIITNLASGGSNDNYQDVISENFGTSPPSMTINDGMLISQWIDRGDNYTQDYIDIGSPYSQNINDYDCLWTSTEQLPNQCLEVPAVYGALNQRSMKDGKNYVLMPETHEQIGNLGGTNYIGNSGDDFKISIEKPVFFNTDYTQDLSKIKVNMKKIGTFYGCNNAPTANITFDYKLYLYYGVNGKFHPTKTDGLPSFETEVYEYDGTQMGYDFYQGNTYCRGELNIEIKFDSLKALEFSDWVTSNGDDISNVSGYLHFYDMKNKDNPQGLLLDTQLPFAGNSYFLINIEADYISATNSNFFLKGGALILGVGLFALSIASTPYWDPFKNLLQGAV